MSYDEMDNSSKSNNAEFAVDAIQMTEKKQYISSIPITSLHENYQPKLRKFNTTNDGHLTLEQAVQGLITLQKQSNNYKRMLWLLIPVLIGLIAATFGTTMAAFKINQQTQVVNSELLAMDGQVIRTSNMFLPKEDLFTTVLGDNAANVRSIIADTYYVEVNGVVQNTDSQGKILSAIVLTPYFSLTVDGTDRNNIVASINSQPGYEQSNILTFFSNKLGVSTVVKSVKFVDESSNKFCYNTCPSYMYYLTATCFCALKPAGSLGLPCPIGKIYMNGVCY